MGGDNVVHISEQARVRYQDCLRAIEEGRTWAQGADIDVDAYASQSDVEVLVASRHALAAEMERSFHANVSRMFFRPASDGMLTFHTDIAPLSFFWRYESGYHGGLIFHSTHRGSERLPVGVWSVHT